MFNRQKSFAGQRGLLVSLTFVLSCVPSLFADKAQASKWEPDIKAFEMSDQTNPPPKGAILFVGSSSIRLWKTLAEDLAGHKVINRGFGGSQIEDATRFAGRIVLPYQPRMVVLYAGDNDIASGKGPEQVFADYKAFVQKVHSALPKTKIAFISIKPSPSRWHLVERIKVANRLVAEYARMSPKLVYIDVFTPTLGDDGKPRADLFIADNLHLNAKGYELWTSVIRPYLK